MFVPDSDAFGKEAPDCFFWLRCSFMAFGNAAEHFT